MSNTTETTLTVVENNVRIVCTNPDARFKDDFRERFKAAVIREVEEFFQEVKIRMRHVKPGETIELSSRPIVVTISRPAEEIATEEPKPRSPSND